MYGCLAKGASVYAAFFSVHSSCNGISTIVLGISIIVLCRTISNYKICQSFPICDFHYLAARLELQFSYLHSSHHSNSEARFIWWISNSMIGFTLNKKEPHFNCTRVSFKCEILSHFDPFWQYPTIYNKFNCNKHTNENTKWKHKMKTQNEHSKQHSFYTFIENIWFYSSI